MVGLKIVKALIFTAQFCSGAAERLGVELAVDFNRREIHADVMSMYSANFENAAAARVELLDRGIPNVHFLNLTPSPSIVSLVKSIFQLNRLIRQSKYQIVETSSLTPAIIASWACIGTGARHVAGLHQTFDKNERRSLKFRAFLCSVRMRSSTQFYAISDFVRTSWGTYSGLDKNRTRTLYNSANVASQDRARTRSDLHAELSISQHTRLILCVGRLAGYKRQDLVIEALARVIYSQDLAILFVGKVDESIEGTREMISRIEAIISRNALENRVQLLGQRSDVHEVMAASDLLVHATEKEGFGLVLAESLALGLQVVSTNAEAIPEILRDTDSIMVEAGDTAALRQAVLKALSRSDVEVDRAKAKGIKRAAIFDQRTRTNNMAKLFEETASN
jgi:glycosyltransferase involved in cell wall biosynthesis